MFFWDLISVLPFGCISIFVKSDAINNLKILRVVRLLRLVKLQRILRTGKLLKQVEDTMAVNYNLMTLVKFIVLTLFIAHWLACGWHLVVRFEGGETSWVSNYFSNWVDPYEDPGAFSKYLAALYWAFVTMSTIGYGDVVPTTDAERFFEIVAMLCGTSVFAYVVGSVCTIVGNMDRKNGEFFELMDSLNAFMADLKLKNELRVKLRQYFHYRRRSAIFGGYQGLLGLMSPELQGEVASEQCGDWVNKVPFFKNAPAPFIARIAKVLHTYTYPQGEEVIQVSTKVESLYIVQRGVVGGRGRLFTTGKVFGQDILAGEGCATYTATALSFTDVYGLLRDDLEDTLVHFPKMKHRLQKAGQISVAKEALYAFTSLWKRKLYGIRLSGNATYIEDLLSKSVAEENQLTPVALQRRKVLQHISKRVDEVYNISGGAERPNLDAVTSSQLIKWEHNENGESMSDNTVLDAVRTISKQLETNTATLNAIQMSIVNLSSRMDILESR